MTFYFARRMNRFLCVSISLTSISLGVNAYEFPPCKPRGLDLRFYAGVDAQVRDMRLGNGYGSNIFKQHFPQGNVYAGLRIHDYFGVEFGYETTPMRTSSPTVGAGELSLGVAMPNPPQSYITKSKLRGWSTGVTGYLPVCDVLCNPMELFAYVGQVRLRNYNQAILTRDALGAYSVFDTVRTFAKQKYILKLGVGAQYTFCTSGVRFMLGYENTQKFQKLRPIDPTSSQIRLSFRSSLIWSVGAFITMP